MVPPLREALSRNTIAALAFSTAMAALLASGCKPALPPGKPIAELTPQESAGYSVFQQKCARCHNAYSSHALHGPSLEGVLRQPYLPSGAAANDERIRATVLHGRGMMPAFGNELSDADLAALIAYLHTL